MYTEIQISADFDLIIYSQQCGRILRKLSIQMHSSSICYIAVSKTTLIISYPIFSDKVIFMGINIILQVHS